MTKLDRSERMIGLFGKREMELAAMVIVDKNLWNNDTIREEWFEEGYEAEGFRLLKEHGWISMSNRASQAFWDKVRGK